MKSPFKKIKIIIFAILIVVLAISAYFIEDGYKLYKSVIQKQSIEDKVKEMQSEDEYVKIDEISNYMKDAVISIEDKRFYEHFGVDLYSIARAFIGNLRSKELSSGGSTITQQLAKNMYFSQQKKLVRKIAEIFVALDLEEKYEKDEILELYLNIIYFGDGYYGVKEASNGYLDKEPKDLTLYEASLLAGIPNAPSVYQLSNDNPYTYQRQKLILEALLNSQKISLEEYNATIQQINGLS